MDGNNVRVSLTTLSGPINKYWSITKLAAVTVSWLLELDGAQLNCVGNGIYTAESYNRAQLLGK